MLQFHRTLSPSSRFQTTVIPSQMIDLNADPEEDNEPFLMQTMETQDESETSMNDQVIDLTYLGIEPGDIVSGPANPQLLRQYLQSGKYKKPRRSKQTDTSSSPSTAAQLLRRPQQLARALEQYYTPEETVTALSDQFIQTPGLQFATQCTNLIDPSFGSGNFTLGMVRRAMQDDAEPALAIGMDVVPIVPRDWNQTSLQGDGANVSTLLPRQPKTILVVLEGNFLEATKEQLVRDLQELDLDESLIGQFAHVTSSTCMVGVPPFRLAIEFFEKGTTMADYIAMLFPAGFSKQSNLNRLNRDFELVTVYPFRGMFEFTYYPDESKVQTSTQTSTSTVAAAATTLKSAAHVKPQVRIEEYPALFQVWRRRLPEQGPRPLLQPQPPVRDFSFVQQVPTDTSRLLVITKGYPQLLVLPFEEFVIAMPQWDASRVHLIQFKSQFDMPTFRSLVLLMQRYFDQYKEYFLVVGFRGYKMYGPTQNDIKRAYSGVPPAPLELIAMSHQFLIDYLQQQPQQPQSIGLSSLNRQYDDTVRTFLDRYMPLYVPGFVEYLKAVHHPLWLAMILLYLLEKEQFLINTANNTAKTANTFELLNVLHDQANQLFNIQDLLEFTARILFTSYFQSFGYLVRKYGNVWRPFYDRFITEYETQQNLSDISRRYPTSSIQSLVTSGNAQAPRRLPLRTTAMIHSAQQVAQQQQQQQQQPIMVSPVTIVDTDVADVGTIDTIGTVLPQIPSLTTTRRSRGGTTRPRQQRSQRPRRYQQETEQEWLMQPIPESLVSRAPTTRYPYMTRSRLRAARQALEQEERLVTPPAFMIDLNAEPEDL